MARVEGEDALIEKVIVWSDLFEEYVPPPQIQHGNWLAVLRDGLAHGYHDGRDPADAVAQRAALTRTDPLVAGVSKLLLQPPTIDEARGKASDQALPQ
jgi:hypothetical protein